MSTDLSPARGEASKNDCQVARKGKDKNPPAQKKAPTAMIMAVVALSALLLYAFMPRQSNDDPNKITFSGRIESPETYVTAGVASRVNSVLVQEGDHVRKGQLLLTLDARALKVKMQATGSQEALARQAQGQAGQQVQSVQEDVQKARKKSKGFFAKIFTSRKKKEEVKEKLTGQMKAAQIQAMQAKAAVIRAQAEKGEVSSKISYFNITSPIDGVIVTRSVDPGEAVAPGQILFSVADPNAIYMKGFIQEGKLSQVKLGQKADIFLDDESGKGPADKGHTMSGHVTAIDDTASFTPQNVYFKDDRVKQVYGIKLNIDEPDGRAKAGMPVEAQILLNRDKN
ncbi:MAG: efflux RND transporter periplasmic adaptor subunit [Cyanobacteria bacterium REEB67]|nr:efflux RND transporter periplasmic adaptor subunit [Cyanobacteria bacterium REEB67]